MTDALTALPILPRAHFAPCWRPILQEAVAQMDHSYLRALDDNHWLPGPASLFNAFCQPVAGIRYILVGESPYPRAQSANGYAFWDSAVHELWSPTGLAKPVNRATSLRNFIKMLLVAEHGSSCAVDQASIAALPKEGYITTVDELFSNMLHEGFLLLNASLVLSQRPVRHDARQWRPFMQSLLHQLTTLPDTITLILWGNVAQAIDAIAPDRFKRLVAEHPYNVSFIHNPDMLHFFHPLHLLLRHRQRPNV
jgi:uracil-DNA glycosylase